MGSMLKADICGIGALRGGFLAIADENAADGTTYRIQFKSGAHIQEAIKKSGASSAFLMDRSQKIRFVGADGTK